MHCARFQRESDRVLLDSANYHDVPLGLSGVTQATRGAGKGKHDSIFWDGFVNQRDSIQDADAALGIVRCDAISLQSTGDVDLADLATC
ncbi:hypothetical protein YERSI8AC_230021 [Enterobacterales bacterium 8AC]|nr:hypothetical protein YERSI8AC_230021 [Enterobacterales bacterium 8AC]